MRLTLALLAAMLVVTLAVAQETEETPVQLAEPYTAPYAGDDATGGHVMGLWHFDGDEPGKDLSGNGHDLTLNGAQFVPEGKFGGSLQSGPGWPVEDKPHQATAKDAPKLSPKGAFSIEMWLAAKAEIEGYPECFLVDKQYIEKTDYQLVLSPASGMNLRTLRMRLGFGEDWATYTSTAFEYKPGEWHHIAFTYDGAGTGRFFIDGASMGAETMAGRQGVAAGTRPLVIGDRVGSLYHGFPGNIDQVRICSKALDYRPAGFEIVSQRRVFVRMEQPAQVTFEVTNKLRQSVEGAKATLALGALAPKVIDLPVLEAGSRHRLEYTLDTSLRPDQYKLAATINIPGEVPFTSTEQFAVTLVPRPLPNQMPVVMWGASMEQLDEMKQIGFTHCLSLWADFTSIWKAGEPIQAASDDYVATCMGIMDEALANGIGLVATLSPGSWARGREELRRVGPDGKPEGGEGDVCGLFPEVPKFCYNVGASVAQTYGGHPALQSALIHTEVRGATRLCYHDHDREAFRKATGLDIPKGLQTHRGTQYQSIDGFPADRVIPDDYPMYRYYKWFWKEGDGWNAMHTALHDGLKSTGRDDLWTFHDPAVRVASVYGNGGNVDYLSQWTYSYPDPIRIGLATDELFCMAGGAEREDQKVMKMTQIIWYRSQTAPEPGEEAKTQAADFQDHDTRPKGTGTVDASGRYQAEWEQRIPDARFITIAPMHLREAFWTKIARPIQGIMYHGWGSLVDLEAQHSSYRYTHPETKYELKRLVENVVRPLGPMLIQVPDHQTDVAFLESFASQMFAKRGTYGWNGGWAGDAYEILNYAHLQPQVIYDETVQEKGLDQYKVLVLVDCDVLIESVVEKIKTFQDRGGLIIADENLCPAIQPDILLESHARPKEADVARQMLIDKAQKLCEELDPHYSRHASASSPNIVTRVRSFGTTDYLFAVNDLREFGGYVGHHGLVMENGLPENATLTLKRSGVHVYDLLKRREIQPKQLEDGIAIDERFGPCDGRLYMVTDQAIDSIRILSREKASPGDKLEISVAVTDEKGSLIEAVVPLRIELIDPDGKLAEYSGYYGAKRGQVTINAGIAQNDALGLWRVHVEDLASGRDADAYIRVGVD